MIFFSNTRGEGDGTNACPIDFPAVHLGDTHA